MTDIPKVFERIKAIREEDEGLRRKFTAIFEEVSMKTPEKDKRAVEKALIEVYTRIHNLIMIKI